MKNLLKTKLRKGDLVIVNVGKHKGVTGKIEHIDRVKHLVTIENVNIVRRHAKPSPVNPDGFYDKTVPVHISNVAYFDQDNAKATKLGYVVAPDRTKKRFLKSSKKEI